MFNFNKPEKAFPVYIVYLLRFYLLGLAVFSFFRLVLFLTNISTQSFDFPFILKAFSKGLQFDTVVLSYMMALPFLFFAVISFFDLKKWHFKLVHIYLLIMMVIAIFINVADIPYFNYNFSRLSAVIFNFKSDTSIILNMIKQEPTYFIFVILFFVLLVLFGWLSNRLVLKPSYQLLLKNIEDKPKRKWIFLVFFLGFVFMGIRGRIDSPIKIKHSFFCNDAFYNQLGINPVFSLAKSFNSNVKLMDNDLAVSNTAKIVGSLNIDKVHPLNRKVLGGNENKKNVVLVIMESFSAKKMQRFGNTLNLTPHMDSLYKKSIAFDNIYSAGRHTYNGIFSTLYSYPAVLRESPMENLGNVKIYNGIPHVLKSKGYKTNFFITCDRSFDNIGGFMPLNGFDSAYSQIDYDSTKIVNAFGVSDHVMFDYSLNVFDSIYQEGYPFFGALMTVSDHGPYVIPEDINFKAKSKEIKSQIIEYCDWAIARFLKQASAKPWYGNTIFVFVADHGVIYGESTYELPLSYHHVPLLIYANDSQLIKPQIIKNMGGQVDVFPTVMGLLNMEYSNTTFGIDLLKKKREYMFFSSDDKLGCIDDEYYYIYNTSGRESLFKYRDKNKTNLIKINPSKANKMRDYVLSNTQAAKYLMENNITH